MSPVLLLAACAAPPERTSRLLPGTVEPVRDDAVVPVPDAPDDDARPWTIAIWMDGDNDLEPWMKGDLDELERGAVEGFTIVVQADRAEGYATGGGDWTGTRRIEIVHDEADGSVSPVLEDLGEVDMGDGAELAAFLDWTEDHYPAERLALVFWNHGAGFWIANDEGSGGDAIHVGDGELEAALAPLVARRGRPIDVVAFDACNMGEWEVATALHGAADVMVASQAWVGYGGYAYDQVFPDLAPDADAAALGARLAWSAGVYNEELTHAAVDLRKVGELTDAVDALAGAWLDEAGGVDDFARSRDEARGLDKEWDEFWLDLGSLADAAGGSSSAEVVLAGADVREALDLAVIASHTTPRLAFASGLTVFADTTTEAWLRRYDDGPWADTRWDDLLDAVRDAGR